MFSANDGHYHLKLDMTYYTSNVPLLRLERTNITQDSFTVIQLGPDHPPITKTVYGTVPNTILGAPYLALSRDGRLAFVPCQVAGVLGPKPGNVLSVIDLSSPDFPVVQKLDVQFPILAVAHPDGKHLVVGCATGFKVFEIRDGRLTLKKDNQAGFVPDSFDISPDGARLVSTVTKAPDTHEMTGVHCFRFRDGAVEHESEIKGRSGLPNFDQPFSLRFTPDGRRVIVPNGGGVSSKGKLDDVLIIDMTLTPPTATDALTQVADGIESLAVHPGGKFAVLSCLEDTPGDSVTGFSHLAVVDLTSQRARVLYELPVECFPEGIEFTPDGSQLFVQLTSANRIAAYEVNGLMLNRNPFVVRVGHAPSSLGICRSIH